jgi:serine/threonine protein kinase/tetratricopeptide (TPR) repeat protein
MPALAHYTRARPMEPVLLGKYRLSSRLATGGMAEVYLARALDPDGATTGRSVAVKRLLPHLATESQIVRMFLNEARITAQIDHRNVVRILDLGSDEEHSPFIVMELLDGHSFAEIRHQAALVPQRVPLGITLRVLTEACRGLDAAHNAVDENGRALCIVHRDFTPENIHVGFDGQVKVIDFGIARAENATSSTEPGTLKGKFFYMSPEMIVGRPVDHRADIYAAGVMLYEQLCGRRPFTGQTAEEVVDRIASARLKRPSELDPSVPRPLEEICLMALARDPDQRFASLDVFISSIEAVGGLARIATEEQLSMYVTQLFPVEKDAKRQALMKARAADPSVVRVSGEPEPAPGVPAPRKQPSGARSRSRSSPAAAGAPPPEEHQPATQAADPQPLPEEPATASSPPPSHEEAAPRRPRRIALWAGVALVPIAAAAAFVLVPRTRQSVADRIQAAQATDDRAVRIARLAPLAASEDATADQLGRAVELLLDSGAMEEALDVAEGFSRRFPKEPGAPLLEAHVAMALRRGKKAEAALDRASALSPTSPEPDLVRAELKQIQGDSSGAQEALAAAEKKKPGDPDLLGRTGVILSRLGVLAEAGAALTTALTRKFDPLWAAELGYVRLRQEQMPEAAQLLRRALRKEPALFEGHYYLGALLVKQQDVKGAEKSYREAARLRPTDPRPLVSLCALLIDSGQTESALEVQRTLQEQYSKEAAQACRPPKG